MLIDLFIPTKLFFISKNRLTNKSCGCIIAMVRELTIYFAIVLAYANPYKED